MIESAEQTPEAKIKKQLSSLDTLLNEELPGLPTLLRDIHTQLRREPHISTLLTEEECSILVRGLKKQTNTVITASALKAKPKKALKSLTTDDL